MKLLILTTNDFAYNGITNNIYNYFKYMDKNDMEIDFVVPSCLTEIKNNIVSAGGKVFEIKNRKKKPIKYFLTLVTHLKKHQYDIIHCHGNSSTLIIEMMAAKLAGIKVRIVHSRNSNAKHKYFHKVFRPIFLGTMTHKFACGQLAGEWMFGKSDFEIIRNGNDIEKFRFKKEIRHEYRKRLNIKNDTIVIGHVGNFNYQKNHEYLIDIFNALLQKNSNYKLILIGDGENREKIENKIKYLEIEEKVILVGQTSCVEKYLQAMDIMLLTSRYEGLPNVVIEWQINGLPSIISNEVTKEVAITSLINYCSINDDIEIWVNKILNLFLVDRQLTNEYVTAEISEAGFDIRANAISLRKKYDDIFSKMEN